MLNLIRFWPGIYRESWGWWRVLSRIRLFPFVTPGSTRGLPWELRMITCVVQKSRVFVMKVNRTTHLTIPMSVPVDPVSSTGWQKCDANLLVTLNQYWIKFSTGFRVTILENLCVCHPGPDPGSTVRVEDDNVCCPEIACSHNVSLSGNTSHDSYERPCRLRVKPGVTKGNRKES